METRTVALARAAASGLTRNPLFEAPLHLLARLNLLPRFVWARLPVHHDIRVEVDKSRSFLYHSTAGDLLGRSFFWGGIKAWEYETTSTFLDLCKTATLVLDIGANTGSFSLLACAANPRTRVLSFEPVPRNFSRLLRNLQLNGFDQRCEAFNIAVSDRTGTAEFHVPFEEVPASSSLDPNGYRGISGELITVPVNSIDAIIPPGVKVDVAKIDVEKFEHCVLNGMERILAESRPAIVIECLPDGPYEAVEQILSKFGYRFFHLRSEGPVQVRGIVPDTSGRFRNYLCRT
jgi:FkbM family methyltransferase